MGIKRYELNDVQWARIAPLLPGKASPGRTGLDNRLLVNGCLWVWRSGAHWCDLRERYGRWKTVHRRFSRWCHTGVWERVFDTLAADCDNSYLMIDSAIVRAHQQAAARKGGPGTRRWAFLRRTDTKIQMLADTFGRPLQFRITPGQASDITVAPDLLKSLQAQAVLAPIMLDLHATV